MNSAPSLRGHHALQTEPDTELLQSPPGAQVRGAGRGGWRGRGHGRLFQTFQKVVGTRGQKIPIARLAGILWLVDYSCSGMKSSKKMTFKKLAGLFPIQTPLSLFAGKKKKKKKAARQQTSLPQRLKDQPATSPSPTDFPSRLHCGEAERGGSRGGPSKASECCRLPRVLCRLHTPGPGAGHRAHRTDQEAETQVT